VNGAPGHKAAHAVLADQGGEDGATKRPPTTGAQKGLVEKMMETEPGRRAGYALARNPALRPIARRAARRKGS
jgi:hypothetical protein